MAKFYVVWKGHQPGIYESWPDCKLQVEGFKDARYKSFPTKGEAIKAFREGGAAKKRNISRSEIIVPSISVDAACSGNPGLMEYQGVDTATKDLFFHKGPFLLGTNNIGEFLALVHALALLKKEHSKIPIYSDSRIAIGWVQKKKAKSKLPRNEQTEQLWQLIDRAEAWLQSNSYPNRIIKWETESWGEIPADFGRK